MDQGWIKLHRKILDNPIVCKDADHIAVWLYLLLQATHKKKSFLFGKKKIDLMPGQLIISAITISRNLNISESKVRRCIKNFKSDGQIDEHATRNGRLITIVNWGYYQKSDGQSDGQVTDKWRTSDGQVTPNKNVRMEECKNEKKREYIISDSENHELVKSLWSETGLPNIKKISTKRNQMLNARLKEHGEESFKEIVDQIKNSAFLRGQNKNGWSANFDWVIKPTNYLKILEGTYRDDNRKARDEIIEGDFSYLDKYNLPD